MSEELIESWRKLMERENIKPVPIPQGMTYVEESETMKIEKLSAARDIVVAFLQRTEPHAQVQSFEAQPDANRVDIKLRLNLTPAVIQCIDDAAALLSGAFCVAAIMHAPEKTETGFSHGTR